MPVNDFVVIAFGLLFGSFLNVCIYRLPRGLSVVSPRSKCPRCNHQLRAWENLPVFSYLLLRGRCSRCGERISWVYPSVEIMTALVLWALYSKYGLQWPFAVNGVFFCMLVVLIFVDLHERILPDQVTLGGALFGLLVSPLQSSEFFGDGPLWNTYGQSLLGALLGGGVLWLVAWAYLKIRKVEGMGFGDIKMMLMVGTFLGWRFAWLTIFLGSLIGAVVGAAFIYGFRKGRRYELPFGSFLGAAAMIVTLWGASLLQWYFAPS